MTPPQYFDNIKFKFEMKSNFKFKLYAVRSSNSS